jgi:hypothetical protein
MNFCNWIYLQSFQTKQYRLSISSLQITNFQHREFVSTSDIYIRCNTLTPKYRITYFYKLLKYLL